LSDTDLVVIGQVTRPHGVRGELRVAPLTDDPRRFARVRECVLWDAARDRRDGYRVTAARMHGDAVLLSLAGCDSPEAARGLVGRLVALPRGDALPLPEGRFYAWQLEGCRVTTDDGHEVGTVARIESAGPQELWVVRDGEREHLIPAVPEIVAEVDLTARRVVIRPPQGLLEL
jgi:16S rRNA processing protein RimM